MKPSSFLTAAAAFAVAFLAISLSATSISFEAGATRIAPGLDNVSLTTENGELRIPFDPKAANYIEVAFRQPATLPEFTHVTVVMKFKAPADTPITKMGLRLVDAQNETFQFSTVPRRNADGTLEAFWILSPDSDFLNWGGNNDGVIDMPVRLNAFSVDYNTSAPATEITLVAVDAVTDVLDEVAMRLQVEEGIKKYVPGISGWTDYPYSGSGVPITFEPPLANYIELVFNEPLTLPEFTNAVITGKFEAPVGCPIYSIGLRMMDSSNEVFQYSRNVNFSEGGTFEVEWDVAAGRWENSWGGNNDHQLDQPMKIYGMGVSYTREKAEASFSVLNFSATVSGGPNFLATRTLYPFDLGSFMRVEWGHGSLVQGDNGLAVNNIGSELAIFERMDTVRLYHARPLKLNLDADVYAGDLKIRWYFKDAAGTVIPTEAVPLAMGANSVEIDLEALLAEASMPVSISRFIITNSAGTRGSMVLKKATLGLAQPMAETLDFEVMTGNGVHVLKDGQEGSLAYRFTNTSAQAGTFTARVTAQHFNGARHTERFQLALEPGASTMVTPAWTPELYGHWELSIGITEATYPQMLSRKTASFAYLQPAGPTPGLAPKFLFGVCTHSARWSKLDQLLEAEAASICGVKVARCGVDWGGLQPERGVWNYQTMDNLVRLYGALDIELQAMYGFTPKWAAPEDKQNSSDWLDWNRSKPEADAWREYVSTVAKRYRGQIRLWEVWNEPDLYGFNRMSLEEYVDLQKMAYEETKKVAPEALVMTGGFATMTDHPGLVSPTFHRDYLMLAKGYFDIHAYHEHGSFTQYVQMVEERFLPMREQTGTTAPWYANETAIHSLNGAERGQALTLFKKLLYAWSRGSVGFNWYDLRNDGFDPVDGEHNYGMLTNDFYPKPVYSVFNMLAGLYRDMDYVRDLEIGENYWGFEFSDGRDILLPAWDESSLGSALALVVRTDAAAAATVDLMGNETAQEIFGDMTLLSVTTEPSTLKLTGAGSAEIVGRLLEVSGAGVAVPGRDFKFTIKVFNPLDSARNVTLVLNDLPKHFTAATPSRTLSIPGGQTAEAEFTLTVGTAFKPTYGTSEQLLVNYTVANTPWSGSLVVPVNSAILIPFGENFNRAADFVLNRRDQVVSLTSADPALSHRVWTGPEDLSANIHLGYVNGNFRLHAEVTDDIHAQPYTGYDIWSGDSIQFAFQVPGQQGYWEMGLAHLDSGQSEFTSSEAFGFNAPRGFNAASAAEAATLTTRREGTKTFYDLTLPGDAFGLTNANLTQGFRFNLQVNDNDGEGRDGWIQIAPGIGGAKNPDEYPFIVFE